LFDFILGDIYVSGFAKVVLIPSSKKKENVYYSKATKEYNKPNLYYLCYHFEEFKNLYNAKFLIFPIIDKCKKNIEYSFFILFY
jgi:hypothetical protein